MKKIAILLFTIVLMSCGASKQKHRTSKTRTTKVKTRTPKPVITATTLNTAGVVIQNAEAYNGVKYKYGGVTKKGMDCSGLMQTAFNEAGIKIPRTTRDQSTYGDWIDLKTVKKGDLLFFATKKNSRNITHVGMVTEARVGYVKFIHASSSKGVIHSLLSERYWYLAFVQARRYL